MLSATRPARTVTALLLGALALAVGGLAPAASAGVLDEPAAVAGDGPPGELPAVEVLSRSTLSPVLVVAPGCVSALVRLPLVGPVTWWVVTGAGTASASQSQPVDPRGTTRLRAELSQGARFTDGTTRTEWVVAPAGADLVTGCEPAEAPPTAKPLVATPPVVEPPVVKPPGTKPPVAVPPATKPRVAVPPVVEPPVAEAPAVQPRVDEPPAAPADGRTPAVVPAATATAARPATAPAGAAAGRAAETPAPARPATLVAADRRAGVPAEPVVVAVGGALDAAPAPGGAPDAAADTSGGTGAEAPGGAVAAEPRAGSGPAPARTVALAPTSSAGTTGVPVAGLVALLVLLVASGLAGAVSHRPASATAADQRRH